jgi:hypothetical protein
MNIYRKEYVNSDGFLLEVAGQTYTFAGLVKRYEQICNDADFEAKHPRDKDGKFGNVKKVSNQAEYEKEAKRIYRDVASNKNTARVEEVIYSEVSETEAIRLKRATGLDLVGYKHKITNTDIRHILKEHGEPSRETPRGQKAVEQEDILLIPEITKNYDSVELLPELKENKRVLRYKKKIGNEYYYLETIGGKDKRDLRPKSMWIKKQRKTGNVS